ncbi:MAG: hypothetical protein AAFX99_30080 [Myxococcota bacterium]
MMRLMAIVAVWSLVTGCCVAVVTGDGSWIAKLTREGGGSEAVHRVDMKPGEQLTLESSAGFWGPIGLNWQTRIKGFTLSEPEVFQVQKQGSRKLAIEALKPGRATLEVVIVAEGNEATRTVKLHCRK